MISLLLCHNDVITINICGFYKTSLIKNKKEKGVSDLKKDKRFKGIEYYRTKQVFSMKDHCSNLTLAHKLYF